MGDKGFYKLWGGNFPNCVVPIEGSFRPTIRGLFPSDLGDSGLHITSDVALVPEPTGPHGPDSISVRIDEKTIGYLPAKDALAWSGPILRVVASGLLPTTRARLFAIDVQGHSPSRFLASIRLYMDDPVKGLPFNSPPSQPYTLLPRGSHVKLSGVEQHLADLLRVTPSNRCGLAFATLHESCPTGLKGKSVIKVCIDETTVGQLTQQMSKRYLPMIQHFENRGLIATAYIDIAASAIAAQVRLYAAKANEVDDEFLDGSPVTLPELVPVIENPINYDLSPMADYLDPRPLPPPAQELPSRPFFGKHKLRAATFALAPGAANDPSVLLELASPTVHEAPASEPPAELAKMLSDLCRQYGEEVSIDRPADALGAVITIDGSNPEVFSALFRATEKHVIAAYDTALHRLYSSHGSESVHVILGGAVAIPYANPCLLGDIVRDPTWPDPDAPFVIVQRDDADDDECYVQMYLNDDASFQIEYRDGSFEQHFGFNTADAQLAADAMWAWVSGDHQRFRTMVNWERIDMNS